MGEVAPFLLHLSPQVKITPSGATDYLDNQAGIVRTPREKLEKRLMAVARSLGKERFQQAVAAFMNQDRERMSRGFIAKLEALPRVHGQPDLSAIGNPSDLAKQWAAEMKLPPEEFVAALLKHLGADGQD
jgi:hypothetical protein